MSISDAALTANEAHKAGWSQRQFKADLDAVAHAQLRKALWFWADEIALKATDAVHISHQPPGSVILWQWMRNQLIAAGIDPWIDGA